MPEDQESLLRQIAIDVAVIKTKLEETEKLNLAARVAALERYLYMGLGGLVLINAGLGYYIALHGK